MQSEASDDEEDARTRPRVSKLGMSGRALVIPPPQSKPNSLSSNSGDTKMHPDQATVPEASSSKGRSTISASMSRKPFTPTPSTPLPLTSTKPSVSNHPTKVSFLGTEEPSGRKRKVIPIHYRYEDISDDDGVVDDGEYVEPSKERRKSATSNSSLKTKAKAPGSSGSSVDRRHSLVV